MIAQGRPQSPLLHPLHGPEGEGFVRRARVQVLSNPKLELEDEVAKLPIGQTSREIIILALKLLNSLESHLEVKNPWVNVEMNNYIHPKKKLVLRFLVAETSKKDEVWENEVWNEKDEKGAYIGVGPMEAQIM